MDFSTVARLPVGEKPATLFVALELSKATWLVALHSPAADKISLHRLAGGDTQGLLTLIERKRDQAQTALARPVHVISCYEAGYDGFWLHRLLCASGIDNRVLEAASILVDRRSRRAKTDRLDAAALLRTLMALERGEPRVCRVVRVLSPEHEDTRRRSRERAWLVNERTQHTSRIKGLLMTQGIRDFAPTRRDWRERLDGLRTADGHALLPCLKAEIARECRRLWQVIDMIAEVEAEQHQVAAETTTGASQLSRLRGIGLTIASVLGNEVFFRTFQNRREIAGDLGLAWRSRLSIQSLEQRLGQPRSRHPAIRQPTWAPNGHRACLAVAAPPTRERPRPLVSRTRRHQQGAHPPHDDRCSGAQTDDRPVAVCDAGAHAGGGGDQGLTLGSTRRRLSLLATKRDGYGPVVPGALMPV
jgi:transposase